MDIGYPAALKTHVKETAEAHLNLHNHVIDLGLQAAQVLDEEHAHDARRRVHPLICTHPAMLSQHISWTQP